MQAPRNALAVAKVNEPIALYAGREERQAEPHQRCAFELLFQLFSRAHDRAGELVAIADRARIVGHASRRMILCVDGPQHEIGPPA
jgi:hypothetical protein